MNPHPGGAGQLGDALVAHIEALLGRDAELPGDFVVRAGCGFLWATSHEKAAASTTAAYGRDGQGSCVSSGAVSEDADALSGVAEVADCVQDPRTGRESPSVPVVAQRHNP